MAYNIEIANAAENDVREAFMWYEDQKDDLGGLFENHINKSIESLRSNPLKTQIRYGNTRVFFLDKFPYGIHFQVKRKEKSILIVAVFHTSRDPKKWTQRKKI